MLYRSTDRLSRGGAPMKNLAHTASFESLDKDAPSKPRTEQLGQRLEDLRFNLALKRLGGDRPDELEGQLAVSPNDERLGHAVHAPIDAGAVILVETHLGVRVAFGAKEAPDVLRRVLLRDAVDGDALGLE